MSFSGIPSSYGLYDPGYEKESCGVGFVAHIRGEASHQIVRDAETVLRSMSHRGACGCEKNTGDGAGILTALPHAFFKKVSRRELRRDLPGRGKYGAGNVFLPVDAAERAHCKESFERVVAEQGQEFIGWRRVPTDVDAADVGKTARAGEPVIEQVFIGARGEIDAEAFERQLFVIRKRASAALRGSTLREAKKFYVCSLSTKVIVYKGQLTPEQLFLYYADLADVDFVSHLAMVHSRFSTNTFPSWDRAHPQRFMSHNGEINTVKGNANWMHAREGVLRSSLFSKADLESVFPIVEPDGSDSGNFDNVLEFLLMGGRTLQEAIMMMIPEAWQNHSLMSLEKRAFYEFHSCLMEPWDGPASIAFTDGHYIGAVLDRNGLRPSRYYITDDDRVIMASEVGVLPVDPARVTSKWRLQPGRMFLVDFAQGRIIRDEELKKEFAARRPYGAWLDEQRLELDTLPESSHASGLDEATLIRRLQSFGYTTETIQFMLVPMVKELRDPVGSMGNDASLACLSDKPRLLYDYFKQLFAQVTNPPIDSIREEIIMSLECYVGPEGNLLDTEAGQAHRLLLRHPILTNAELARIRDLDHRGWRTKTIDITFPRSEGEAGLETAITRVCADAEKAIEEGYSLICLSDRAIGPDSVPLSSLLACGAVHHHLVRKTQRTRIGIIIETGEAREVHHHCLLCGYGADAINPYLAFECLWKASRDGIFGAVLPDEKIEISYRKAVAKGILKVMAKMGISTLQSYKGAQIFEAVGLQSEVIDRCFVGTASRIQGCDFRILATETLRRHEIGYPSRDEGRTHELPNLGEFHWRSGGERHMWNPRTISELQVATRINSRDAFKRFSQTADSDAQSRCTLRGLLRLAKGVAGPPVPIEDVEPAAEIVKRFCTGAMSFGSISAEAHETLAVAMNRMGGRSNTGEGGEDSARFVLDPNGDSRRSAIKQVASGRFGVTIWYLANADELQIKMAQGAKPGEGGELPGHKVDAIIARTRHSTPGVGLISPPPHHDIYSIEDLAQLIHDLKNSNPSARISVKLVSEIGVGTIAAGVAKAHADHILISGHDGGTGASPLTSIKHAGLPFELGIAETHQTLVQNDLRSRVVLQTDGQLKTGRDVVIAALLGAEEMGFSTAPLVALGCIMMRKCHLNTCPVGIATQDPVLREKFRGLPEHVTNYFFLVAEEAREIMAQLGFRKFDDMIGRVDVLETDDAIRHWKADGLDLSAILAPARKPRPDVDVRKTMDQDHDLENALDQDLISLASAAIERGDEVVVELPVKNTNRTVGTILSHTIVKRWGEDSLPDGTIHVKLRGSAGQSLGAFLAKGITIELEGDANDFVGKGLSGGRLILYPDRTARFRAEENIIAGNVCLYGATSGEAYFRGIAAERFCVRNSGARAVIEGVGDHGCEYMTGGRVVCLGRTGRNFAAGMSGGVAYVYDREEFFIERCNLDSVEIERMEYDEDVSELRHLITEHHRNTRSTVAEEILANWEKSLGRFIKVMPTEYKLVLQEQSRS
jgi:glutamate synthase (NADPH/NADH) large chain